MTVITWPNEYNYDETSIEFQQFFDKYLTTMPDSFNDVVEYIKTDDSTLDDFKKKLDMILEELQLNKEDKEKRLSYLASYAKAKALVKNPTVKFWEHLWGFQTNHYLMDFWLADVKAVYQGKEEYKQSYVKLAKEVLSKLGNYELKDRRGRVYSKGRSEYEYWKELKNNNQGLVAILDGMWYQLESNIYANYYALFRAIFKIDAEKFILLLNESDNPYFVDEMLDMVTTTYREWEELMISAPNAFDSKGDWTGTIIAPCLLSIAYHKIYITAKTEEEVKSVRSDLVNHIMQIIAKRVDAEGVFARWTTWIMNKLLMSDQRESYSCMDVVLLEVIGNTRKNNLKIFGLSNNVSPWEHWAYQCVIASYIFNGVILSEDCNTNIVINDFTIKLKDWYGVNGETLRKRSERFCIFSKDINSKGSKYLAFLISQSADPVDGWINLWCKTEFLREVVEYGVSFDGRTAYQVSIDANKLVWLLFCIGLALFDQLIEKNQDSRQLIKLYQKLYEAINEMLAIFFYLDRESWQKAQLYLAMRRVAFQNDVSTKNKQLAFFNNDDKPTFIDFLEDTKNDVMVLLDIISSSVDNANVDFIKDSLKEISIDLAVFKKTVVDLNKIDNRRYPLNTNTLKKLDGLIG